MDLSSELLSQFVKVTQGEKKTKNESTVYGTAVKQDGKTYVKIDGSNLLTPVAATADTVDGERVIVMIKNHTATITGNITAPAARVLDIEVAVDAANEAKASANQANQTANQANQTMAALFDLVYPVGSIYMSVNNVSPALLFGGTWEPLHDRFLLGAGNTYSGGATGGEASHTLTVNELPTDMGHLNAISWANNNNQTDGVFTVEQKHRDRTFPSGSDAGDALYTLSGGGIAHNNMPPYLAVYIWKRVADATVTED